MTAVNTVIDGLPAATTPLAGSESLLLVQAGQAVQAPASAFLGSIGPTGVPGPAGPSSPPGGTSGQIQYNNAGSLGGLAVVPVASGGTGTATPSLVAGTNVTITGTWPDQTVNSTAAGTGTVTSVGATVPAFMAVAGTPITTSGTLALSYNSQAANEFLASPNGAAGVPAFRAMVGADVPPANLAISGNGGVTGTLPVANGGTGTATPALVAGTNVTISGAWPDQTVQSTGTTLALPFIASIAATVVGTVSRIETENYAVVNDNGGAVWAKLAVAPSPVKAWHAQSADGIWFQIASTVVLPEMFGAKGDNATPDDVAIANWFACGLALTRKMRLLGKTYLVNNPLVFDYASVASYGFEIYGDGIQKTILRSTYTAGATAAFAIICSGGTTGAPVSGVYPTIKGIGFQCNQNNSCFKIGNADFSDYQNKVTTDIWIANQNDGASAAGLEVNALYSESEIRANVSLGSVAATGANVIIRKSSFTSFYLSLGSTSSGGIVTGSAIGVLFETDFNLGNAFYTPDLEVLYTCVKFASGTCQNNTFYSGTFALTGGPCVIALVGNNNLFINPNKNAAFPFFSHGSNAVGVAKISNNPQVSATPASGATLNAGEDETSLFISNGGTTASLTINLPTNPGDQQEYHAFTLGAITSLTVNGGSGSGDTTFGAPTVLMAGGSFRMKYTASGSHWLPCG